VKSPTDNAKAGKKATTKATKATKAAKVKAAELPDATVSEMDGLRYLHLETPWVQGAMRIRKPVKLELDYVQRMMAWLLLKDPVAWPETRTLQLGLGAAAITKYCHSVLKVPTTAVELNPKVVAVCRAWFHLPEDDERLSVVLQDAERFVNDDAHIATFDAMCVDLYDHEAASPVLDDEDFYRACWRVLDDGGVMTVNLFGRDASFERSASRIEAAFGQGRMAMLKPTREGNTIVLAWKGFELPEREVLAQRAETLQARWELPAAKWVKLLSTFQPAKLKAPKASKVGKPKADAALPDSAA
jgi:spermidine synthase